MLEPSLVTDVISQLGLPSAPCRSPVGLTQLYCAWCRHVPFDNVRRLLQLKSGQDGPLPGVPAAKFFADWLRDGTGGLCVPTAVSWHALLIALGFDASRVVAAIGDDLTPNHLTVVVRLDAAEYLVDTVNLCEGPVALSAGGTASDGVPSAYAVAVESFGDSWRLHYRSPTQRGHHTCTLLHWDAPEDLAVELYRTTQAAAQFRQFNAVNYSRRNLDDGIIVVAGLNVARISVDGVVRHEVVSDLQEVLVGEIGYSTEVATSIVGTIQGLAR